MVKIQNPEKDYPSAMGQKWTDEEETSLLEELTRIDIETIAQLHNRSIGGINARRREIAYKMYLKNISMEEIIEQTKLDVNCIRQTIERRNKSSKSTPIEPRPNIESEIIEMKNELKELKNVVKDLASMLKAVYEFEDVNEKY
jgi:hypothetical protein